MADLLARLRDTFFSNGDAPPENPHAKQGNLRCVYCNELPKDHEWRGKWVGADGHTYRPIAVGRARAK